MSSIAEVIFSLWFLSKCTIKSMENKGVLEIGAGSTFDENSYINPPRSSKVERCL